MDKVHTNIYKSRTIIESDTNTGYNNRQAVSADNYVYARNGGSVAVLEGGYKGDRI